MIDQAILDQYVEDSSMMMNETSKQNLRAYLIRFFSQLPDMTYAELDHDHLVEIFSRMNILSTNSFESYKSKIGDFMRWMNENGYGTTQPLKELQRVSFSEFNRNSLFDLYYFIDYADLLRTMEIAFAKRGTEFDTFRAAAMLVWHGMELKDLTELLKKDVLEDESCILHPVTREKIPLDRATIRFLINYRNATTYDSNKFGGVAMAYAQTAYLFRTYKSAQMTLKDLSYTAIAANKAAEEIGKKFTWKTITLSGIYNRLFEYEQKQGKVSRYDYETLTRFFQRGSAADLSPNQKRSLSQKYDEYTEFKESILLGTK